jgi:hypothetical protein
VIGTGGFAWEGFASPADLRHDRGLRHRGGATNTMKVMRWRDD